MLKYVFNMLIFSCNYLEYFYMHFWCINIFYFCIPFSFIIGMVDMCVRTQYVCMYSIKTTVVTRYKLSFLSSFLLSASLFLCLSLIFTQRSPGPSSVPPGKGLLPPLHPLSCQETLSTYPLLSFVQTLSSVCPFYP